MTVRLATLPGNTALGVRCVTPCCAVPCCAVLCRALQEPALYTGSSVYDRQPDQTQCCLAVAFKGAAWTDPDSIPLMVMQTLLGGWDRNNTSGKHAGEGVAWVDGRRTRAAVVFGGWEAGSGRGALVWTRGRWEQAGLRQVCCCSGCCVASGNMCKC